MIFLFSFISPLTRTINQLLFVFCVRVVSFLLRSGELERQHPRLLAFVIVVADFEHVLAAIGARQHEPERLRHCDYLERRTL